MSEAPPGGLFFGAADRNKQPIADALTDILPAAGTVVEIAAGAGQHAAYLSGRFPHLSWLPTEPEPLRRISIEAWRRHARNDNLLAPVALDVCGDWPIARAEALYTSNLVHVSSVAANTALLRGAGLVLATGAPLCVYGPFRRHGAFTTPSNAAFDVTVRGWNTEFGIRDLEALIEEATDFGLHIDRILDMPANNFLVVWRKG